MLLEMEELLRTAGVDTVATIVQHRDRPHPSTYLGPGKLQELKELAERLSVEVIVCDDELTPRQQRRLEDELQSRVVDRTAVILDIFAQHAHTAEGKLQVELAQLEYNLQRMRGMWKHLERLGGGIGTRGPGESQLESDRRMARRRITLVRGRLRDVAARRDVMRQERARNETPSVVPGGVHERRQVDAPERPHRQPRQRQQPAVRDARPDHPRVQRGRSLIPRDRHGRVHPQAATPAGRGLRGHARGDAGRRPGAAGGRCVGERGRSWPASSRTCATCWTRSRPRRSRSCWC